MKKAKQIIIVLLILIVVGDLGYKFYEKIQYNKKYEMMENDIFVVERNAVFELYETIGLLINSTEVDYASAYEIAVKTEEVCMQTYGVCTSVVNTYGTELVYYATFYRDIKALLALECDDVALQKIHDMLGKIVLVYDAYSNPDQTDEKVKGILAFYQEMTLLQEEMVELNDLY